MSERLYGGGAVIVIAGGLLSATGAASHAVAVGVVFVGLVLGLLVAPLWPDPSHRKDPS